MTTATAPEKGQVVTFYSFKGGVGRTMALANVAFLAACNGLRVLAMDWDLEAPGLVYYFKGMRDSAAANEVRTAPGVLNLLWKWVGAMREARTKQDVEALLTTFQSGEPFERCLRQVCDPAFFEDGCLDFIGAGSPRVDTPASVEYEEALTKFPWNEFFDEMAGGYVAESLRSWAKERYDLILVDSRTGLAEAAGLCTMQLPDTVVLCFILNRQNIDGVARISGAIRQRREAEVKLLAAPMRVGRQESSEESDARARAISELTRIGGFQVDAAQQQLRSLAITQTDGVPFYEMLAPIAADDPRLDALTLNYLKLASEVTGRPLEVIEIDPDLASRVRTRLQPRHATVEYVTKLAGGEPVRVIEELRRLLDSAAELALDRAVVDENYVSALVGAALTVNEPAYYEDVVELQRLAIDLLRMLYQRDARWASKLADTIELYCAASGPMLDSEEEVALRDELDTLLSMEAPTVVRTRRVSNRRRSGWLHYFDGQNEAANQAAGEVFAWIKDIKTEKGELSIEAIDELLIAEADMKLLRGNILERKKSANAAAESYGEVVSLLVHADTEGIRSRPEARRILADAHVRMALLPSSDITSASRREHAIEAASLGTSFSVGARFPELVALFLTSGTAQDQDQLVEFLEQAIGSPTRSQRTLPASYFGRSPRQALAFFDTATLIATSLLAAPSARRHAVVEKLLQFSEAVLVHMGRRRLSVGGKASAELLRGFGSLLRTAEEGGVRWRPGDEASSVIANLGPLQRQTPRQPT